MRNGNLRSSYARPLTLSYSDVIVVAGAVRLEAKLVEGQADHVTGRCVDEPRAADAVLIDIWIAWRCKATTRSCHRAATRWREGKGH